MQRAVILAWSRSPPALLPAGRVDLFLSRLVLVMLARAVRQR
jgi:hypothetical protein